MAIRYFVQRFFEMNHSAFRIYECEYLGYRSDSKVQKIMKEGPGLFQEDYSEDKYDKIYHITKAQQGGSGPILFMQPELPQDGDFFIPSPWSLFDSLSEIPKEWKPEMAQMMLHVVGNRNG